MLDSRAPPAQVAEEEKKRDDDVETEIQRLMLEARIWRVANSAQWVAWGIVQAKVPGMDDVPSSDNSLPTSPVVALDSDTRNPEAAALAQDAQDKRPEEEEDDPEFDYLTYAHERAMFFWGDVVQLGFVKSEELPEGVRGKLKVVEV